MDNDPTEWIPYSTLAVVPFCAHEQQKQAVRQVMNSALQYNERNGNWRSIHSIVRPKMHGWHRVGFLPTKWIPYSSTLAAVPFCAHEQQQKQAVR